MRENNLARNSAFGKNKEIGCKIGAQIENEYKQ